MIEKRGIGVLYMVWPGPGIDEMLERSIASLKAVHPELPVHVERLPFGSSLLDKATMYDVSPFANTLYLDADTVVLGSLDFGFEHSWRYGLCVSICECPWARRFSALSGSGDQIEYNTGVIFFSNIAKRLFDRWKTEARGIDGEVPFKRNGKTEVMAINDQASFSEAVHREGWNPCVLPLNWNFRPQWHRSVFGPIKVWHDRCPVPPDVLEWNERQTAPDAIIDFATVNLSTQELAEAAA